MNAESKLEQAAAKYANEFSEGEGYADYHDRKMGFIAGANWQSLTTPASTVEEGQTQEPVGWMNSLPSIDEAGVIAVRISENIKPELTAKEQALLVEGFQECVKYLKSAHPLNYAADQCSAKDAQISDLEKRLKETREALADYMYSEGCRCCEHIEPHEEAKAMLGNLLGVEKYEDGSFNFSLYRSKENEP